MILAVGSDHAGYKHKEHLMHWLQSPQGGSYSIRDVGTGSEESCDYPDFAKAVAMAVAKKKAAKGILICGTGIGMAMAANKVPGVRAAVAWNPEVAALASEHNKANILCLPARYVSFSRAQEILAAFLKTPFGGGRHARRVKKMMALDQC